MKSTYSPASRYPRARGVASGVGGLGAGLRSSLAVLRMIVLTVLIGGCMHCGPNPGETPAEAGRRRERVLRLNFNEMMADVDNFLMLDEPSRLTQQDLP